MDKAKTRASLQAQIRAIEAGSHFSSEIRANNGDYQQSGTAETDFTDHHSSESTEEEVFKKIIRLVKVRERATEELRTRFLKDGFDESVIESALQRVQTCNLLNDERFAEILIRSRLSSGKGEAGIRRELSHLNIEIPSWMEEEFFENEELKDEFTRAMELLSRKPPHSKNLREGAYRKLVQKGYSSSIASEVARKWYSKVMNDSLE